MSHERIELREAVKRVLESGVPGIDIVHVNRSRAMLPGDLPALILRTPKERAKRFASAPRILQRELTVEVEAVTHADDGIDRCLDELAKAIERRMAQDPCFGGRADDSVLASTEMEIDASGDTLVGAVKLIYKVTYQTDETVPGEAVAFGGINARIL